MIQAGWRSGETGEGVGTEADGEDMALAAVVSKPFPFNPVVLPEFGSVTVGFSLSE
jgi:hypothetical protein